MDLQFPRGTCPSPSREGSMTAGRHGNWSNELRAHILNGKEPPKLVTYFS